MRSPIRAPLLVVALLSLASAYATAVEPIYPGALWDKAASPEALGYSTAGLREAREYTKTTQTAAVMIVVGGQVLDEWGETTTKFNVHSIRKSFLSALYGIHVAEGTIDLSRTMSDLGVDDKEPSLTPIEKRATLRQLLQARSGVYHPALYETKAMAARRPARSSHEPGTFWYYNNWDFNALGTIFRNLTRTDIFQAFKRRIADPIGMQDYNPATDGQYVTGDDSVHAAYPFRLTARDMARFGLLFLRNGRWKGLSVVPESWVKESVTSYSDAGASGGYGYLWWISVDGKHLPGVTLPGAYSARGAGGHFILVIPDSDLVIVHRVDTDIRTASVSNEQFGNLVRLILAARTRLGPAPPP
jgi:CubicO group peptidase (beta-lactamase class C family)